MSRLIVWQQDSHDPDNGYHLGLISQWWESLDNQEINWKQRLIPENNNIDDLNWENQRFDEKLPLKHPEIRGITLYWQKAGEENQRNITPSRLELDPTEEYLDIYPQSQPKLVIRVVKPPQYKTLELEDPLIVGRLIGDRYLILVRDQQQKLEIRLNLSSDNLQQFMNNLPK